MVDFSLAKLTGQTGLTRTGSTIGTAAFMSPEQVEGRPVNHQTDIWSLGVTLFYMVSGASPFKGEVDQSVMYSIVNHEPAVVTLSDGQAPKGLDRILEKALRRDLSKRYQSVSDMGNDLLALRAEILSGDIQTSHPRFRALKRGRPRKFAKLAFAVGILLLAAGLFHFHYSQDVRRPVTIAVLPMTSFGSNTEDWFRESMADALITNLAKVSGLSVISYSSIRHFRAADKSIADIARELDVSHVIECSILRVGNNIRISPKLLDVRQGKHILNVILRTF